MKTIIAVGRIVRGGAVEITAPTLEERVDAQIERNAERLAMNAEVVDVSRNTPSTDHPQPGGEKPGKEPS